MPTQDHQPDHDAAPDPDPDPAAAPSENHPSGTEHGRPVVGYLEAVGLPEWGVRGIRAKIDTGARTSAIHVESLELSDDKTVARFNVVVDPKHPEGHVPAEAPVVRVSKVRPSTGVRQRRIVVETTMQLGPVEKRIEVSLVRRDNMTCRMLVGRTALGEDFLIDASLKHVHGRPRRVKPRGKKP